MMLPRPLYQEPVGRPEAFAEVIGGAATLGTLIGAIAGGGKGAAIGALSEEEPAQLRKSLLRVNASAFR